MAILKLKRPMVNLNCFQLKCLGFSKGSKNLPDGKILGYLHCNKTRDVCMLYC